MGESSLSQLHKQADAAGTIALGGGGSLVPAGVYVARVVKSTTVVNASDKRQFKLQYEIEAGQPEAGGTVWDTITISPESEKALGIAFAQLDLLGATASVQNDDPEGAARDMLGSVAEITVYVDNWQGKDRSKIRFINPVEGAVPSAPVTGTGTRKPF
jgi:hypothetical protein